MTMKCPNCGFEQEIGGLCEKCGDNTLEIKTGKKPIEKEELVEEKILETKVENTKKETSSKKLFGRRR